MAHFIDKHGRDGEHFNKEMLLYSSYDESKLHQQRWAPLSSSLSDVGDCRRSTIDMALEEDDENETSSVSPPYPRR